MAEAQRQVDTGADVGPGLQGAKPPLSPVDISSALARIKGRCKPRVQSGCCPVMSPIDENTHFNTPVEITVPGALFPTVNQVIQADPNRVGLLLSAQSTVAMFITTSPKPGSGQGFQLTTANPNLFLTQSDYGSLVTMAWFTYTLQAQPSNLTVWNITLRQWPSLPSSYGSTGAQVGGSTLAGGPGETEQAGDTTPTVRTAKAQLYRQPPRRIIHPRRPIG